MGYSCLHVQSGNGFTIYCMFDLIAGDRNEVINGIKIQGVLRTTLREFEEQGEAR